mmetsp:Transcript_40348/g.96834  ORF Transcript_40348/g.96834 Transcript_40348/m.96834 type:complete len:297 (-) Transcript_40348:489-1379(-)
MIPLFSPLPFARARDCRLRSNAAKFSGPSATGVLGGADHFSRQSTEASDGALSSNVWIGCCPSSSSASKSCTSEVSPTGSHFKDPRLNLFCLRDPACSPVRSHIIATAEKQQLVLSDAGPPLEPRITRRSQGTGGGSPELSVSQATPPGSARSSGSGSPASGAPIQSSHSKISGLLTAAPDAPGIGGDSGRLAPLPPTSDFLRRERKLTEDEKLRVFFLLADTSSCCIRHHLVSKAELDGTPARSSNRQRIGLKGAAMGLPQGFSSQISPEQTGTNGSPPIAVAQVRTRNRFNASM